MFGLLVSQEILLQEDSQESLTFTGKGESITQSSQQDKNKDSTDNSKNKTKSKKEDKKEDKNQEEKQSSQPKLKVDDLVIPKFIGEVTGNNFINQACILTGIITSINSEHSKVKHMLFKVKTFNTYKQNISDLNGASREELLEAAKAINPLMAPFLYGYTLPGLKHFLISSIYKLMPYMCRGCNDEVQYFVNDPLPIFSCLICGIGACKSCFNSESTTSKTISLCLGCEDSLLSKCELPHAFT